MTRLSDKQFGSSEMEGVTNMDSFLADIFVINHEDPHSTATRPLIYIMSDTNTRSVLAFQVEFNNKLLSDQMEEDY